MVVDACLGLIRLPHTQLMLSGTPWLNSSSAHSVDAEWDSLSKSTPSETPCRPSTCRVETTSQLSQHANIS
jgi:hypothetical protein